MTIARVRFQHDSESVVRDTNVVVEQRFDDRNRTYDVYVFADTGTDVPQLPCKDTFRGVMSVLINSVDSKRGGYCEVYSPDGKLFYAHPDAHSVAVIGKVTL